MSLVLKMRIDEQPEHSYVFSTGDGGQIELIPLSVVQNGSYTPEEGKAYNFVTVNVPETELEHLNITANGTYTAEDGKAYDVVTVNVQPILESVTRIYTENGTYTIEPSEGKDGLSDVIVDVDVPTSNIQPIKHETIRENGHFNVIPDIDYDAMGEVDVDVDVDVAGTITDIFYPAEGINEIPIDVPEGKTVKAVIVQTYDDNNGYNTLISANGMHVLANYTAIREGETSSQWYFNAAYKAKFSDNKLSADPGHARMLNNPQTSVGIYSVCFNQTENKLKYNGRVLTSPTLEDYGLAKTILYEYIIVLG